ncbi:Predicted integral membrane protein [Microbacterium sp. C448]|uniref:TMEM175 family protein n=1 Tax=Microbacterium TaxID=33882 RepID=UPI0003DE09BD|nr:MULTISPECIES: TMEM175 family protein [Microbacterium]CDK00331.1 Predicted integral membrane protein [Microbacterium sp. C448]
MIRTRRHPAATQGTSRLEAFTDGVFAIAATLLVLDLTTYAFGPIRSDADMWSALGGMGELFLNFALSFLLLCLLWMTNVQQFEHIARVDSTIIWLNNVRLLFIVLVPFATSLTTEYSSWLAGRLLMPVAFFFAILTSYLQWMWAVRNRSTMLPDLSDADAKAYGRGALSALVICALVVLLAPFIGSLAFLLFFLDRLGTRLFRGKGD